VQEKSNEEAVTMRQKSNDNHYRFRYSESGVWSCFTRSSVIVSFLGIGRLLGPLVNSWQRGLIQGFKAFFIATAFQAIGYFCTALCLAEMLSALPFTGGTYGIVRGILGPYLGFIAGLLEALALIGTCTELLTSMGLCIIESLGIAPEYQFLFWVGVLLVSLRVQVFGQKHRLHTFYLAAILSIVFCLIYIATSMTQLEAREYFHMEEKREKVLSHFGGFVDIFPFPTVLYGGLQWIPMIAKGTDRIRPAIAAGILTSGICIVVLSTLVVTLSSLQFPGPKELALQNFPLSYGFAKGFGMSVNVAGIVNLPLLMGSFLITMRCLSVNLDSMSESGLLFSAKSLSSTIDDLYERVCLGKSKEQLSSAYHDDHSANDSLNSSYHTSSHTLNSITVSHSIQQPIQNNNSSSTLTVGSLSQSHYPNHTTNHKQNLTLSHFSDSHEDLPSGQVTPTLSAVHSHLTGNRTQGMIANNNQFLERQGSKLSIDIENHQHTHSSIGSPAQGKPDHAASKFFAKVMKSVSMLASHHHTPSVKLSVALMAKGIVHFIVFLGALIGFFAKRYSETITHDTTLCYILCILSIYVIILVSYLSFHVRFFYLARSFKNPLGWSSAFLGIVVYCFIIIATLFYKRGGYVVAAFICLLLLTSLSYWYIFKKYQRFNDEEEQVMFVVYVMKANQKKLRQKQQQQQQSIHTTAGAGNKGMESSLRSNQARVAAINRRQQLLQKTHHRTLSSDSQSTTAADMLPSMQLSAEGDQASTVFITYSQLDHANVAPIDNPPLVAETIGSGEVTAEEAMEGMVEPLNANGFGDGYQEQSNVGGTDDVEILSSSTRNSNRNSQDNHHSVSVSVPGLLLEGMQVIVNSFSSINSFSSRGNSAREWHNRSTSGGSGSASASSGSCSGNISARVPSRRSSGAPSRHSSSGAPSRHSSSGAPSRCSSKSRSHSGGHSAELFASDKAASICSDSQEQAMPHTLLPTTMSITAIDEEDELSILPNAQTRDIPHENIERGHELTLDDNDTGHVYSVRNKPHPRLSRTFTAPAISTAVSLFLRRPRLSSDSAPSCGENGGQEGMGSSAPAATGLTISSFSNTSAKSDDIGTVAGGNNSKKSALGRDRAPSPSNRLLTSNKNEFFFPLLLPQLSLRRLSSRVGPASFPDSSATSSNRHHVTETLSGEPDIEMAELPTAMSSREHHNTTSVAETQHETPHDHDASRMRHHHRPRAQADTSPKHSNGTPGGGNGGQTRRSFAGTMLTNLVETFSSPTEQQIASLEGILAKEASLEQAAGRVRIRRKLHFDANSEEIVAEPLIERRR
jgi:hypothetical protein